jgi:(p)ppGpp synthase/HD superfamily hydrolase
MTFIYSFLLEKVISLEKGSLLIDFVYGVRTNLIHDCHTALKLIV